MNSLNFGNIFLDFRSPSGVEEAMIVGKFKTYEVYGLAEKTLISGNELGLSHLNRLRCELSLWCHLVDSENRCEPNTVQVQKQEKLFFCMSQSQYRQT